MQLLPPRFYNSFHRHGPDFFERCRAAARPVAMAVLLCALPVDAPLAQSDADLLAAKAAFDKGDRVRLRAVVSGSTPTARAPGSGAAAASASASPISAGIFAGHVLEPYVVYWQLKLALDAAAPEDVRAFLERYPNSPLAERLRVDWLKALGKRGDWNRFALDYPPPATDDVELACYGVAYLRQRDGDVALGGAKPLWFNGQPTPESCDSLFAALIARGDLTVEDRRTRFRLAVEAGQLRLAAVLAAELPGKYLIAERDFAQASRDPLAALNKGAFAWNTPAGRDLALVALERAARTDAAAARAPWVKVRDRLPKSEREYGNARLAFYAARQLNPSANDWFREARATPLSAEAQGWQVRAALRAGDWNGVAVGIDAMPDAARQESPWRYWQARALQAKGRDLEAKAILTPLATEPTFYGVLAAEALGNAFVLPNVPGPAPADAALSTFGARADVRRAVKLYQLDMRPECQREWYFVVRGQPDDTLLLAADYARRVGMYDRAINAADRTRERHDYSLRYLAPFRTEFAAAAKAQDVDLALLYGIARQESRFNHDIVSSAGAVGLMQLMPGTARWVAKQLGRTDYRPAQIGDNEINTHFGAYYFKYWLDRLDRMPALAAAAYNAGPGRAQAWRPPVPLEGAAWVESIPFNETRDYVKKVLANSVIYGSVLGGTPPSLTTRLGVITPRNMVPDPALTTAAAP